MRNRERRIRDERFNHREQEKKEETEVCPTHCFLGEGGVLHGLETLAHFLKRRSVFSSRCSVESFSLLCQYIRQTPRRYRLSERLEVDDAPGID